MNRRFLYDAVHLGPDFRDKVRGRTARQFGCQHETLRPNRQRGHFLDRGRRGLLLAAAADKKEHSSR